MTVPNRIILPLDGSKLSHAALPIARSIASTTRSGVTLVSVIDPPGDFYSTAKDGLTSRYRPQDIDHLASEEIRLQKYLDQIKTTFRDIRVSTDVRLGDPATEILEASEVSPESMIIMASHGRSGLGRMILGSVAGRVVQGSHVPVIVIRASSDPRDEFGTQQINHLAVALDGSKLAEQALDRAWKLFGNSVRYTLMRIVEPISPGHAYNSEAVVTYEREARNAAEDYLAEKVASLTEQGASVNADVRVKQPSNGITQIASEFGADMIVMSTHGRSGLGRFVMGSVAEKVLHDADRPVMIVRGVETSE